MKFWEPSRRRFLLYSLLATPVAVWADAKFVELTWVRTRTLRLTSGTPSHRIIQITDIHHKSDRAYLESVVRKINALSPDVVLFTGDLIENARYVAEALEIIGQIKSPIYAVPGNHDYWSGADFGVIGQSLAATGGALLLDQQATCANGSIHLSGDACMHLGDVNRFIPRPGAFNILMIHYPVFVEGVRDHRYDLILAGHSHGGQVRIPFYGPLITLNGVGRYDLGLFKTPAGPLYVNPGLGWLEIPLRFNCRPEITVFEV